MANYKAQIGPITIVSMTIDLIANEQSQRLYYESLCTKLLISINV